MEISNYTLIEIKPREGMWLTQVADLPDEERFYSDDVFIGGLDDKDNWREATQEEKDAFDARVMEKFKVKEHEEIPTED